MGRKLAETDLQTGRPFTTTRTPPLNMGETSRGSGYLSIPHRDHRARKIFTKIYHTGYPLKNAREETMAALHRGLWSSKAPIRKLELRLPETSPITRPYLSMYHALNRSRLFDGFQL